MSNLTIYEGNNFDVMQRVAKALAASGFFDGDIAKAITKVMAGQELGLPPFASMSGIHVISGKPVLGANLIASLIKSHPRYNYRVKQMDEKAVLISFFENGEEIGISSFTIEEARKAGTKNLDKFPRNMLFARAISNGARWYCPDIFGGSPVYTPDEMGMSVDEDGYIDGEVLEQAPPVALIAPYTYADGSKVADAGRDIFDKFSKWHGRIPASRDEMASWYKAQKDGQAPTPPTAPEQGTAGDVDGVAADESDAPEVDQPEGDSHPLANEVHKLALATKAAPNVGDVIAALSNDGRAKPDYSRETIKEEWEPITGKAITPATKVTVETALKMYDFVVSSMF